MSYTLGYEETKRADSLFFLFEMKDSINFPLRQCFSSEDVFRYKSLSSSRWWYKEGLIFVGLCCTYHFKMILAWLKDQSLISYSTRGLIQML